MAAAKRHFIGTIERETEKAVLVNYIYATDTMNHDKEYTKDVWLPKSQIEVYHQFESGDRATIWAIPAWLAKKNNLPTQSKKLTDDFLKSCVA